MSPALIASRMTTSNRFLADAAPKHLFCVSNRLSNLCSDAKNEHSIARVQEALGASHREKSMFFHAQVPKSIEISAIPRKVCVGITES